MKTMTTIKTLLSVAVLAATTGSVWAAPIGTAAGTDINNTASITYSVGGTGQTAIASSPTGNATPGTVGTPTHFVVDKKIDLLVTGAATEKTVQPEQTGAASDTELSYVLTNEGNSTESFSAVVTDSGALGTAGDEFNTSGCTITAPANPAAMSIASGDTVNITVECDIPANGTNVSNGKKSLVDVLATVTGVTATGSADDPAAVDTVFADGSGTATDGSIRNAQHSATSTYIINAAGLTVKKTQAVTAMDASGTPITAGNLYHIPGATVVYTITVVNAAGAATATGIELTDTVPATMTVVGVPTIAITGGNGGAATMASGAGVNAVASNTFDLDADETATMTITATVK
ncbi:MAG: hypothetical protein V3V19_02440 [Cocleimonas sp.]